MTKKKAPSAEAQIEKYLADVGKSEPGLPHIAEVVEAIVGQFGGAQKFAAAFYDNYAQCESNATKGRMLDSVMRLIDSATRMNMAGSATSGMTMEELIAAGKHLMPQPKGDDDAGDEPDDRGSGDGGEDETGQVAREG